jgi:hypothetical protein
MISFEVDVDPEEGFTRRGVGGGPARQHRRERRKANLGGSFGDGRGQFLAHVEGRSSQVTQGLLNELGQQAW